MKICKSCGKVYSPTNNKQKFCGSWREKIGCSYKNRLNITNESVKRFIKKRKEQFIQDWKKATLQDRLAGMENDNPNILDGERFLRTNLTRHKLQI